MKDIITLFQPPSGQKDLKSAETSLLVVEQPARGRKRRNRDGFSRDAAAEEGPPAARTAPQRGATGRAGRRGSPSGRPAECTDRGSMTEAETADSNGQQSQRQGRLAIDSAAAAPVRRCRARSAPAALWRRRSSARRKWLSGADQRRPGRATIGRFWTHPPRHTSCGPNEKHRGIHRQEKNSIILTNFVFI